jgi:hypothetical protein
VRMTAASIGAHDRLVPPMSPDTPNVHRRITRYFRTKSRLRLAR